MANQRILIAGGGLGGLAAALALDRFGFEVCVLEQAAALAEVGAGIQLSPNGMKVLSALGVADRVAALAFRPEALEMRFGETGRTIFRVSAGAAAERRWGAPYLHLHRADLIAALEAALNERAPGAIRLGARVVAYEQDGAGVTVLLADGARVAGAALIGADGIHSAVRAQMLGPEAPRFTGNLAWRAVVPMERLGADAPPPTACVWVGARRHAVTYRLRRGTLANFVGVVERSDWREESWTARGTRAEVLGDFEGWHPIIRTLIEKADAQFRWALFDRAPLPQWSAGRVALLGDACHPMLPFMAQGAVMAIEDAYVLARRVSEGQDDIPSALEAYFAARIARTASVQARARANGERFHQRTALGRLTTYGPMWLAGRLAPSLIAARQDSIYGLDVTA
ncbi:MAG: monooxygenase [Alphaproteobacteria bacterium]|nr:monooxygenase [Alphaproteobacteria bacterium]